MLNKKQTIVNMLKSGKLPRDIARVLCDNDIRPTSFSDYHVLSAICNKLGLTRDDFSYIIDQTFDEIGLK